MSEASFDYANKFWDVLNAITAFAAIQGVVIGVADWRRLGHNFEAIVAGLALSLVMAALYIIAILYLTAQYNSAAKPAPEFSDALCYILLGRIVVVCLFGSYAAAALWGGYRTQ
jgi:hypothetical protein